MEIRIGVIQSARELEVELDDGTSRDAVLAQVERALTGQDQMLCLEDRKGRKYCVASSRLAYVEIGASAGPRKVGFASA